MTKLLIFILLFLPSLAFADLEVSAVKKQQDKDYTITFCNLFKIENISLTEKSFGSFLEMPRELGGYKNLAITSEDLDLKIKNALTGTAKISTKKFCQKPVLKMVSMRKIKESFSVLCQVSFDSSLDIIVFASKYKKGTKDIYKVSYPQDFKFLDKKYKAEVRTFVLTNAEKLLDK